MLIPPFWGDIGMKKWSPFLFFGIQSPIFEHMFTSTFPKVPKLGYQKFGFWVPKNKNGDHFLHANIPQLCNRHLFSVLGGF